jgi:hypothetical protein
LLGGLRGVGRVGQELAVVEERQVLLGELIEGEGDVVEEERVPRQAVRLLELLDGIGGAAGVVELLALGECRASARQLVGGGGGGGGRGGGGPPTPVAVSVRPVAPARVPGQRALAPSALRVRVRAAR